MAQSVSIPNPNNTVVKTKLYAMTRETHLFVHLEGDVLRFSLLVDGQTGAIRITEQQAELLLRLEHAPKRNV